MSPMPERDEQLLDGTDDVAYRIDPSERPSTAVVATVGAVSGHDPSDTSAPRSDGSGDGLPPRSEAIDPDALNAFVPSTVRRDGRAGRVTFEYANCDVTVSADDRVTVSRDAESERSRRIGDR